MARRSGNFQFVLVRTVLRRRVVLVVGLTALTLLLVGCNAPVLGPGELSISVGKEPVAVAIGDVDGDGRNDVATANAGDGTVTVLLQDGWGGFDSDRLTLKLPAGDTPTAIATGHFSSKQHDDVVVAEKGTDTLDVFSDPGNGAKPTHTISLAAGSAPSALAVADLNGDGYDDLAVATHAPAGIGCIVNGCVLVFDGSATGLHAQLVSIGLGSDPNAAYDPVALTFGHYYGTGSTDLAIADLANNRVFFVPGTGGGAFALDPTQFASVPYTHPTQLLNDGPEGKVEIGGGASCMLGSPAGVTDGQSGFPLTGYSFCVPALTTPEIDLPNLPEQGQIGETFPSQNVVGAWNPDNGFNTLKPRLVWLRPLTNADAIAGNEVLKGATAAASGQLVSEWGPIDLAFVYPNQSKVVLALAAGTWSSDSGGSFTKVAAGGKVTKTITGDITDGATPVTDLSLSISGKNPGQFAVGQPSYTGKGCGAFPSSVGVTCSVTFTVTFAPTSAGAKQATLVIDDARTTGQYGFPFSRVSIPLRGTATKANAKAKGTGRGKGKATTPKGGGTTGSTGTVTAPSAGGKTAPARPGPLVTGVADDYGKYAADGGASFFSTLRSAGMSTNRMTVLWQPGQTTVSATDAAFLDRSIAEAQTQGIRVVLSIYPASASQHDPAQFCTFAGAVAQRYPYVKEIIVGNEPNKADFWSPVDPAAYTQLLARCYDVLHPLGVTVDGGALSARQVGSGRSPVDFLAAMGTAYRALGRSAPLMDALSFHPYPNPSRIGKGADAGYEWPNAGPPDLDRVEQAFEDAFGGTAQPTFTGGLRMVIDEIGWQAKITPPYSSLYTGTENAAAVDESQQAQFYAAEVARVECDQAVSEILLLHLVDEKELNASATSGGWQSGLLRIDLSKRPAFDAVHAAISAGCTGPPHAWTSATSVVGGSITLGAVQQQVRIRGKKQQGVKFTVGAASAEGVAWTLTIKDHASGAVVATRKGSRGAPFDTKTFIAPVLLGGGSYDATMTMTATTNAKRSLTATKSASSSS